MSRYQGRKVTNPKLVVHGDLPQYGGRAGLDDAWESMGKAKVELKKAEYRLSEAEKPTAYDIGLSAMQEAVVAVDRVPRYTVTASTEPSAKLDDFGRTSYMKAKMNASRKVSRMDDKYLEEPEPEVRLSRPRSPLREASSNHHNAEHRKARKQRPQHTKGHRDRLKAKEYELDLQPVKYGDVSSGSMYWAEANKDQDKGTNITYTVPMAKKISKVKAEDFKKDSGRGIEMLKEKILMQKLNMSDTDSGAGFAERPPHTDSDVVVPKTYSEYEMAERVQTLTRKVAAGPTAPHYKGFNEAETKYRVNDGTVLKTSELQRYKQQLKKEKEEKKHQDLDLFPVPGPVKKKPSEGQPAKSHKRMSRVVARKSVVTAAPAVITTSSWRDGEKLLQRELGKAPRSKPEGGGQEKSRSKVEDKQQAVSPRDTKKLAQSKPDKSRTTEVLSATAKEVLEALASSDEEEKNTKERDKGSVSPPVKRKRPKSTEQNPDEKRPKVPNYNRRDVQMYMRKKQSQAKQIEAQKREEEKKREELRRQNLQRLYDKQKESAVKAAAVKRRSELSAERRPQDRLKESGGSDKENQHMLESSDSATLTEGSEPTPLPQDTKAPQKKSGEEEKEIDQLIRQYIEKDKVSKEEERRLKEQTTQELIHKYLKADAQAKKEQTRPEVVAMVTQLTGIRPEEFVSRFAEKVKQAGVGGRPTRQDVMPHVRQEESGAHRAGGSKAERLKNLQMMSSSLSTKLRHTAANIASMPVDKWPPAAAAASSEDEFVTRYERIVGKERQEVFTGKLPGTSERRSRRTEEAPAPRMQEDQRTQQVPSKMDILKKKSERIEQRSKSMPSTDESEIEYEPPTKGLSSHLNRPEYCVGGQSTDPQLPTTSGASHSAARTQQDVWATRPDPLSVFNAYQKKQKRGLEMKAAGADANDLSIEDVKSSADSVTKPKDRALSQQAADEVSVSYADDFEVSGVDRTERSERSQVTSIQQKSQQRRGSPVSSMPQRREAEGQAESEGEDTIQEESYSQSTPKGKDPEKTIDQTGASVDEKTENSFTYSEDSESENQTSRHRSETTDNQSTRAPSLSERQPSRTASKQDKARSSSVPAAGYPQHGVTGLGVPRMSPAALEQAMMVELERLQGMEESVKQLTQIDRSRGVSMAQQETVSLAQILKARQEMHLAEMGMLQQRTAQEKAEAARQLDASQKRASEAAESAAQVIHQVRTETAHSFEDSTRRLIESQAHAAKATFEAAKQIAEHMGVPPKAKDVKSTQYSRRSQSAPYTTDVSQSGQTLSYASDSFDSQTSYTRTRDDRPSPRTDSVRTAEDASLQRTDSIRSEDVQTADDLSKRGGSEASIETEPGLGNQPLSPTSSRSIQEDITTEDRVYTGRADTSLTEEEMERSMRDVLPSEVERRKLKKSKAAADISSVTDDFSVVAGRRLSFDEDSFSKFAAEFYEQYVQQEDMRQKHQEMLLKLREKAVSEKLSAEKAWFSQQKKQLRDKGTDDKYPQLKKKQRGVILRLEQEQVEIKKLQEMSRMQQELLQLQMQDLSKRFPIKQRFIPRGGKMINSIRRNISSDSSETELSVQGEDIKSPPKDGKTEGELLSESTGPGLSPGDKKVMQKLKKIKMMDEKYLTVRQQQLLLRRKNAEKLLLWRHQLDLEEREIEDMERKAMALWESTKAGKRTSPPQSHSRSESRTTVIETHTKHTEPRDPTDSIATEIGTETIATETIATTHRDKTGRSEVTSKSRGPPPTSSIQEESGLKKSPETSDDNVNNTSVEYSNDTFEDTAPATKSHQTAPRATNNTTTTPISLAKVHQPRIKYAHKGSESESDDSISIYLSETASDQSDVEGRIRALQEELKRRKLEVERLKREHKKNRKEKLRQKEEQLKTKIEACDSYIQQVQVELKKERDQDPATVKPQIKKPQATSKTNEDKTPGQGSPELKGKLVSLSDKKNASGKLEAKTESVDSYTEDITEDLPSYTDTFHKSEQKLKLDLTEKEEPKNDKEKTPTVEERPVDTARSVSEIQEETSLHTAPISEHTDRTDRSRHRPLHSEADSRVSRRPLPSETEDYSDQSEERSLRSYSDYTDTSTVSKTTDNRRTRSQTERSAANEKREKESAPIPTDEEISEQLSVPSAVDTEEKTEEEDEGHGLTFDLSAPTPVDETNKELERSQEIIEDSLPDIQVGDRVKVGDEQTGTLRYKGAVQFAAGFWAGIELDLPEGSNDGSRDGEQYFSCVEKHGIFAAPEKITVLSQPENILSMKAEDFLVDPSTPQSQGAGFGGVEEEVEGDESMTSLDRAISSAENAVKGFVEDSKEEERQPQAQEEELTKTSKQDQPSFVEMINDAESVDDLTQKKVDKERVSEIVTENLVNDALDTILDIRKKKVSDPTQAEQESSTAEKDEFGEVDIPPVSEVTVHPVAEDLPLRPGTPDIQEPDEAVYDFDMNADGFWEDIEISTQKNEPEKVVEVLYAVPNSLEQVSELVDNTVDVYWEKRRFGESWDGLQAPSDFYQPEDQVPDLDSRSRRVYKHLLFDLAGEILTDMYSEEEAPELPPWQKPLPAKRKYHKGKSPPTVPGEVKPLVSGHVNKYLGLVKDNGEGGRVSKLSGRKKKDNVDQILTAELREEEPDWVNYDADELAVKLQLSDAIFDSLLTETGKIFSGIMSASASNAS